MFLLNHKIKLSEECILDKIFYYFLAVFPFGIGTYLDFLHKPFHSYIWWAGVSASFLWPAVLVRYGSPLQVERRCMKRLEIEGWDPCKTLIITFVSKGNNKEALYRSVKIAQDLLRSENIRYEIEVITDISVKLESSPQERLFIYVVPKEYSTKNGSLYKARALHYLVEERNKRYQDMDQTWVLHMDEESQLTKEALAGIHTFLSNQVNATSIGQGEIKYNSGNYGRNILTLAMDAKRTGDDLARFRLQYKMFALPLFAVHGSYLLIPASAEKKIGFDVGRKGSITEDAYFAMEARKCGYAFRWIDGFIREQSPTGLKDLAKQRRRWFHGLWTLSTDRNIDIKNKIFIIHTVLFWLISAAVPVYLLYLGFGKYFAHWDTGTIFVVGVFGLRTIASNYVVGTYRNLLGIGLTVLEKLMFFVATCVLLPVSLLLESGIVLYAIIVPVSGFEVIQKT